MATGRSGRRLLDHLSGLPFLLVVALVTATLIKTFLVQAFFVDGPSMNPGLIHGDRVLVEKISYVLHDPSPGDVVVFEKKVFGEPADVPWHEDLGAFFKEIAGLPTGGEEDYIKRVVAAPGDSIRYAGTPRRLIVDGQPVDERYLGDGPDSFGSPVRKADCDRLDMEVGREGCLVPPGRIFVMGDNRGRSEDSRALGPVAIDRVIGRGFVVIWPFGDVETL